MVWVQIALFAATLLVQRLLTPKDQTRRPRPGRVQSPQVTPGASIPVVRGTRTIRAPNVLWYGHINTDAIKRKV